jgi:hypothetical protein
MMKIPEQFTHIFERAKAAQRGDRAADGRMGRRRRHEAAQRRRVREGCAAAKAATSLDDVAAVADSFKGKPWTKAQRKNLTEALNARKAELAPKP